MFPLVRPNVKEAYTITVNYEKQQSDASYHLDSQV